MRFVCIVLFASVAGMAQTGVSISGGPSFDAYSNLFDNSGASNGLIYAGKAPAILQPNGVCSNLGSSCIKRSNSSLTSVVDSTNTATVTCASSCGVWVGQKVTFSGFTVDTDLNGSYTVLTVPSDTTYTVTTASVSDATYTDATAEISTIQPLTTQTVWTITALKYDASALLITSTPVIGNLTTGPCWRGCLAWASRATY